MLCDEIKFQVLGNRQHNALKSTLRRHDIAELAERRRRHLVTVPAGDNHQEACRCSCDPTSDGGEYKALVDFKKRERQVQQNEQQLEASKKQTEREESAYERKTDVIDDKNDFEENDSDDEFDYLLDEDYGEDETIRKLEENRRAEMEYQMLMRQVAGFHGYGVHRQIHPNRVLKVAGLSRGITGNEKSSLPPPPSAVVLHLVDTNSVASASLDYFIESELAQQYPGTMFVRSVGRSVLLMNSSLTQKTFPSNVLDPDRDIPALLAIRDGVVINACPRLFGLAADNGAGEIEPHALQRWLYHSRVLLTETPIEDVCLIRPEEEAHMDILHHQQENPKKEPSRDEEHYNCGVEGCQKSFKHEHIGIQTSEQSGLMVREETILGKNDD